MPTPRMSSGKGMPTRNVARNVAAATIQSPCVLQGPPSDGDRRGRHDADHRGRQPIEHGRDPPDVSVSRIEVGETEHQGRGGQDEEHAGHDPARRPVQEPADVDRELLGLGARQHHAERQGVQEPVLADPSPPVHQLVVHDRDLPGGPAEVHEPEVEPEPEGFGEGGTRRRGLVASEVALHGSERTREGPAGRDPTSEPWPGPGMSEGAATLAFRGHRTPRHPWRPGAQPQEPHARAPPRCADRLHRPVRVGEVVVGVRHHLRGGPAAVRRVPVLVRAPVPRADGEARRRLHRGLSPAISIDQKSTSRNPRSTVGTITEVYDYLRVLFARVGHPHCPNCGRPIGRQTPEQIVDQVMELPEGTRFQVLAPVVRGRKGEYGQAPAGAGPQGVPAGPDRRRGARPRRADPAPEDLQAHHRGRRRPTRRQARHPPAGRRFASRGRSSWPRASPRSPSSRSEGPRGGPDLLAEPRVHALSTSRSTSWRPGTSRSTRRTGPARRATGSGRGSRSTPSSSCPTPTCPSRTAPSRRGRAPRSSTGTGSSRP